VYATSTSTGLSSGSTGTPTADRLCAPASPKISPSRLLVPLMTPGWPVNDGSEATKPVTLKTPVRRSTPPTAAAAAAMALSALMRAYSCASDAGTSP
jgi:hypothetical protein